jgi:cyclopropane fatty-acyl-phospholipid synthase-like methyltransferase
MNPPGPEKSGDFFDSVYRARPRWDIGEAQPALMALLDEFPPTGPVLDVGCGTGDLALAIARRGYTVLGVDLAETAIEQARAKAAAETPQVSRSVEFRVGDALHPAQFPGPFGAVVDCGFYHLFGPHEREGFVQELAMALVDGGRYYLLGFAIESQYPNSPKQVREDELRERFALEQGWRILALQPAHFLVSLAHQKVPAVAMCAERVKLTA